MNAAMNNAIIDKLIKLEEYLTELIELKPNSFQKYLANKTGRYATERLIQLVIDLALDINNIIIKNEGGYPAPDYYSSFIELVELKVLDENFAYNIAPSTGLRNRLVHEYEKINDRIVYDSIEKIYQHYVDYIKLIKKYIA